VICEYLDSEFGAGRLVPKSSPVRWQVLADAALADGLADAALLYRNEATRTDAKQPSDVAQWQLTKMLAALDRLEAMAPSFGALDIVQIGFACALGWIEFRMPDDGFVSSRPKTKAWFESISRRPSFQATAPKL
jgi:glutathione S-transferase